jgi:cytochrome c2
MLRKLTIGIALTGLMAGVAYAGFAPKTGINGSFHDMNAVAGTSDDIYGRTCVFCHTPHNAQIDTIGPLWNRKDVTTERAAYGWTTPANFAIDIPDPLVGPTRLCMSCHDGSIAYDSHAPNDPDTGVKFGGTSTRNTANLTVVHPIGFKYADAELARPGELVPTTHGFLDAASSLLGAGFDTRLTARPTAETSIKIADTLYSAQGIMTCATCHDVHNTVNAKSDTGLTYNFFLRAREENSAICLSCHIK